jgi:hypothetical protein
MSSGANAGLATGLVPNSYLVKSYHVFSSVPTLNTPSASVLINLIINSAILGV